MTDTTNTNEASEAVEVVADERTLLMARARMLGIQFSNNISLEKLRERIAAATTDGGPSTTDSEDTAKTDAKLTPAERRQRMRERELALVRIRITCLDPKKADVPGEIITVGNDVLGMVRKYVPFGEVTEDGYHVPFIIYNLLKERQFLQIRTRKHPTTGVPIVEQQWVREFAIEVLPQLTQEELNRLAAVQAAAGGV